MRQNFCARIRNLFQVWKKSLEGQKINKVWQHKNIFKATEDANEGDAIEELVEN